MVQQQPEIKVKLERKAESDAIPIAGFRQGIPVIDLTSRATLATLIDKGRDTVLARLLDNFVGFRSAKSQGSGDDDENDGVEAEMTGYGLRVLEIAPQLTEHCQKFAEYRQVCPLSFLSLSEDDGAPSLFGVVPFLGLKGNLGMAPRIEPGQCDHCEQQHKGVLAVCRVHLQGVGMCLRGSNVDKQLCPALSVCC